jgi:hypothetical protein
MLDYLLVEPSSEPKAFGSSWSPLGAFSILQTITFIDSNISDVVAVLESVRSDIKILLDPTRDGVYQITETLQQYEGLSGTEIVSHGNIASLQLGARYLLLMLAALIDLTGNSRQDGDRDLEYRTDKNDGVATAQLTIGSVSASWQFNGNLGSGLADSQTTTQKTLLSAVSIASGSLVQLIGTENLGVHRVHPLVATDTKLIK